MIPSSLVNRIVIVALLLLAAITSILSYVVVSEDFAEEQANLDAEIQLIVQRFVPIATRATYQLDAQLAEQVIDSILSAEYVIGAKITDDLGQELATRIRYLEIEPNPVLAAILAPHEQTLRLPLVREDPFEAGRFKQYGTLEIVISRLVALGDYVREEIAFQIQIFAVMLIFAVTMVAALYFLLSRPLTQIVNQLSQLESGRTLPLNPKAYGSELNTLVSAINESVNEIDRQNIELQAARARTTQILEEAGDACFLFDAASAKVTYANRQAADLLAMTDAELVGKAAFDIIDGLTEKEWSLRVEFVGQLPTHLREAMLVKATGDRVPVENNTTLIEVDGKPSLLVFARDIASRKRLERDFAHAQRLGALGELTGGVAHDFNNALQVLRGSFEVLRKDEGEGSNTDAYRAAESALEQSSSLVRQLLAFSRKQVLEKTRVNLVAEIVRATPLFQQAAGHHQLKTELMDRDVWLDVDINALNTAVMNLLVNAKHAMETPGQIRLTLELTRDRDTRKHLQTDEQRESYLARLVIEDEGSGIAAEDLDRIFEPYFTTKEAGKGTGLGLSMVYGFMTQIGGKIHVESEAGKGTQFFLYFPGVEISEMRSDTTSSEQTIKESNSPSSPRERAAVTPGTEMPRSVLLVDDNDDVRFISKVYLESAGFTVVECGNGADALDLLADDHNEFLLLITDMIMPGEVTGRVLIEEARRLRPSLPVGVVSGYSDELLAMSDSGEPIDLLHKPFSKQQMIDFAESMLKAAR